MAKVGRSEATIGGRSGLIRGHNCWQRWDKAVSHALLVVLWICSVTGRKNIKQVEKLSQYLFGFVLHECD